MTSPRGKKKPQKQQTKTDKPWVLTLLMGFPRQKHHTHVATYSELRKSVVCVTLRERERTWESQAKVLPDAIVFSVRVPVWPYTSPWWVLALRTGSAICEVPWDLLVSACPPPPQRTVLRIPYTHAADAHWIFIEWVENDLLRGRRIRVLILYLCDVFLIKTCLTQFDLLPYFSNSQSWLWITFDFYLQMTEEC